MDPSYFLYQLTCSAHLPAEKVGAVLEYFDEIMPASDLNYVLGSSGRAEPVQDRSELVGRCLASREALFLNNSAQNRIFSLRAHYLASFAVEDFWDVFFQHPPDALAVEK